MRVTVRVAGAAPLVLGAGETLLFGRLPTGAPAGDDLTCSLLALPKAGTNVSRLLGECVVGDDSVRVRWQGKPGAQLSSLFDAPGGARRGMLGAGMTAMLDEGDNQLLVLRGREEPVGHTDLTVTIEVRADRDDASFPYTRPAGIEPSWRRATTAPLPGLEPDTDMWFVALALAEPWLSGDDDYPRPPTNREISERILTWRGETGRLTEPRRVHDAIQQICALAFGAGGLPFRPVDGRRVENARYAVGRRAAEVGLVTAEQLESVERAARQRRG
ncbi:hypothetical protein Lfu02_01870 [Longispora fulva]|uniref:Uncharacterized protein n=1 Tax=Longispora fulva TaxID=619741 RepID=A0A8J7GE11_9ACTN|nr:hypothetical protein [Longispora fulva]MBG6135941.1 hypothetical protein [Longispora fulva]GIG55815.1 hypothetical protein Lfu02_01870 [Longispora fulva]